MEVLLLEPTCSVDGIEREMTRNRLQSNKGIIQMVVQEYYHKNILHSHLNITLEVLGQLRLYKRQACITSQNI
jgi:hypothetical protein